MTSLKVLSEQIGAEYHGDDRPLTGTVIDSREAKPGDLFICIKGANLNGHEYAKAAIENGAAVLMVDHPLDLGVPEIRVSDTTKGMGLLAALYRSQFKIPVIALTGSCGKTGTRQMIASICKQMGNTHCTGRNYNNHWGLPLTLLNLKPEHEFAVIEMGTSLPGEIEYLAKIARPSVALITNIRDQHVEGLGSREGISVEKSDIFKYALDNAIVVINQDEPFAESWDEKIGERHRVTYSCHDKADVQGIEHQSTPRGTHFKLHSPIGDQEIDVPLLGDHIIQNATAAAAVTLSIGASLEQVAKGLAEMKPFERRLYPHDLGQSITLIDDTYNASPAAVENAVKLLGQFEGKRIMVMSSLAELGDQNEHYHAQMGQWFVESNIDHVLLTGQPEFLKPTLNNCDVRAQFFNTKPQLCEALEQLIEPGVTILVKGTRGNHMEEVVDWVLERRREVEAPPLPN